MMEEQKKVTTKGGTMRLGSYDCKIKKGSKAASIYGETLIRERHRIAMSSITSSLTR